MQGSRLAPGRLPIAPEAVREPPDDPQGSDLGACLTALWRSARVAPTCPSLAWRLPQVIPS
jgi:hypothetical protein